MTQSRQYSAMNRIYVENEVISYRTSISSDREAEKAIMSKKERKNCTWIKSWLLD